MLDHNTINMLHQSMNMDIIKNRLRQHWELLKTGNTILIDCQLIRVYPQKENNFLLHYETTLETQKNTTQQQLWAELVGDKALEHCEKTKLSLRKSRRAQLNKKNQDTLVFCISDLGIVFRTAGLDERLPGLKLLHSPDLLTSVITQTFNLDSQQITGLNVEFLGHRLGKRCIARINYQQTHPKNKNKVQKSIIAKLYKNRMKLSSEVFQLTNRLWSYGFNQGNIRIPKPLAHIDEWNMVLMEDVSGILITEQTDAKKTTSLQQTAEALSKFHQTKLSVDNLFTPNNEISLLENWIRLTALVFPSQRLPLNTALSQIKSELNDIQTIETSLVHRDFYEKQVLLDGLKTTIIDFDTACVSDPTIDLGNYLAHLVLLRLQEIQIPANAEEIFLSAYGNGPANDFTKRINIYKRSTLLRLVCLYSFWPQWRQQVTDGLLNAFNKNI